MSETTLNVVAFVPLKATDVAPVKCEPFTVTVVPTIPLAGVNELIEGESEERTSWGELAPSRLLQTTLEPLPVWVSSKL